MSSILRSITKKFLNEAMASPGMLEDIAALEKYNAESYDGKVIAELLQNADDALSKKFKILEIDEAVIFANDGRHFDENDINSMCFVMAFNVDPDTADIAEVLDIYLTYFDSDITAEQYINLINENEQYLENRATSYQMAINLMLQRGIEINNTNLATQCIDKAIALFSEIENIVINEYPDIIYNRQASEVILDIVQTILDSNQ